MNTHRSKMERVLAELKSKVDILWPKAVQIPLFYAEDTGVTTRVSYTAGPDFLTDTNTPYPKGRGGAQITFSSVFDTTAPATGYGSVARGAHPQPIIRPLELLPNAPQVSSLSALPMVAVQDNKVRCHRIDMKVSLNPRWFDVSSTAWGMAPAGDYLFHPALIMFMWVSFPLRKPLEIFNSTSTSAVPGYFVPQLTDIFLEYNKARDPDFGLVSGDYWPSSANLWAANPLNNAQDFYQYVWNSALGVQKNAPQQVPIKVHKVYRFSFACPVEHHVIPALAIGNGALPTLGTSELKVGLEDVATNTRQRRHFLDISYSPRKTFEYSVRPNDISGTNGYFHSEYGLCKEDLQLVCISNRSSAFWNPVFQGSMFVHGLEPTAQLIT